VIRAVFASAIRAASFFGSAGTIFKEWIWIILDFKKNRDHDRDQKSFRKDHHPVFMMQSDPEFLAKSIRDFHFQIGS